MAGVAAVLAVPVVYYSTFGGVQEVSINILPITEEVFDDQDNLFVFFLDDAGDLQSRHAEIERVIRDLKAESELSRLTFYHNVRKESDPPVPEGEGAGTEGLDGLPPLRVVMYKGQRKKVVRVGKETPVTDIKAFFTALSQDLDAKHDGLAVPLVNNVTFREKVLAASSPRRPILLQMYEDTCFLCFLMRPFVNSIAALLKESGANLEIKRLNLEKNDFPDGCPVARGTPTFVLFRGSGVEPKKWDEFKPKDLCEKLSKEFPSFGDDFYQKLDEMQGLVSSRFQLFTQKVMWMVELQKLERLHSESFLPPGAPTGDESDGLDEDAFNTTVSAMMAKDMQRTDGITENMKHLQSEVSDVEHDAVVLGAIFAARVDARERAAAATAS